MIYVTEVTLLMNEHDDRAVQGGGPGPIVRQWQVKMDAHGRSMPSVLGEAMQKAHEVVDKIVGKDKES